MALPASTALGGAVPYWCLRGDCARSGGQGRRCFLSPPPPCCVSLAALAVCVAGCCFRRSLVLACPYVIPCGFGRSRSSARLPFGCAPRARCPFVRSRSRSDLLSSLPRAFLWAHFAKSPRRALVGPVQVGFAPARFLLESLIHVLSWRGVAPWSPPLPSCFPLACTSRVAPVVGWSWWG